MDLTVLGLNHRTAPVEVRERLSLSREEAAALLRTVCRERIAREAVVLSTCNRTEIYYAGAPTDPIGHLLEHVAEVKHTTPVTDRSVFYVHEGLAATRHLFRVAAALDSQIVGEPEILGQVKTAYRLALDARTARFWVNKVFHRAFRVAQRVRTETDLARGATGVPQAAVELARQVFSTLKEKRVLLIGAGQMAERAAHLLLRSGAGRLVVANRTLERAQALAENLMAGRLGGKSSADAGDEAADDAAEASRPGPPVRACSVAPLTADARPRAVTAAIGLDGLADALPDADLVISSTASPEPVLTYEALAARLRRRERPLLLIDIAVPRDIDPRLGRIPNVFLYNIDDLDRLAAEAIAQRRREIPKAEAIVEAEVEAVARWAESLDVIPVIKLLQQRIEQLRDAEIKRYGRQFSDADRSALDAFARGLCQKILHHPLTFLHRMPNTGADGEREAAMDLVRQLFNLNGRE